MKNSIKKLTVACIAALTVASCAKKLDLFPQNDLTPEKAYQQHKGYKSVLAKIYGTLAITGNSYCWFTRY
jgi:predicted small lipoprotein YifL